jgi:uncharacterized protein Usg
MTIASEGGHWYTQDGTPAYEVVGKDGSMRPTTLRDARKLNLAPSVSAIGNCAPAPQLVNWKLNQVIQFAAENPRGELEGIQAYMDRIQGMSRDRGKAIMQLGSDIHGAIERAMTDTVWIPRPEASAAIKTLGEWAGLDSWRSEKSFCHPLGFGGKCDAHKPGFVVDYKTKEDFVEGKILKTWDNHAIQLAAYRQGFGLHTARCAILYISTQVPGLTQLVEVSQDDLAQGWEMFKALLLYWQAKNKYVPEPKKGTENGKRERSVPAL